MICIYYTDLNTTFPKVTYPLPNIDNLVNNPAGYKLFSFMDAYSGYNQILMRKATMDNTTFVIEH